MRINTATRLMTEHQASLTGREAIRAILSDLQEAEYVVEQRMWEQCPEQFRLLTWRLAGCNQKFMGTQFKKEWLSLPESAKGMIRTALKQLFDFVDYYRAMVIEDCIDSREGNVVYLRPPSQWGARG